MNLHGLASGAIGTVNPPLWCTIRTSTGNTPEPDGSLTPIYAIAEGNVQIQALAAKDIQHLNGLNLEGVEKKAYCYGAVNGVVRASQLGGDLITFPDGTIWLVRMIFESWTTWTAVGLTQQVS